MSTYYIYNVDTNIIIETRETNDPETFSFEYDWDICAATLTPAFGAVDGLRWE